MSGPAPGGQLESDPRTRSETYIATGTRCDRSDAWGNDDRNLRWMNERGVRDAGDRPQDLGGELSYPGGWLPSRRRHGRSPSREDWEYSRPLCQAGRQGEVRRVEGLGCRTRCAPWRRDRSDWRTGRRGRRWKHRRSRLEASRLGLQEPATRAAREVARTEQL